MKKTFENYMDSKYFEKYIVKKFPKNILKKVITF